MSDNLMFFINKLSSVIVAQGIEDERNEYPGRKNDTFISNCVKKVKQKGCDVLLNRTNNLVVHDPCLTDYGGNWSPVTVLNDYARELKAEGCSLHNELLLSSITTLEEKDYDCVHDLFRFLLLLKKPFDKEYPVCIQNDLTFNTSDPLINGRSSVSFLSENFTNDALPKTGPGKKALLYEESWTKNFDSKFQLLGEFSRKSIMTPDKISLRSIFSKATIKTIQSRTNSLGLTDFFSTESYKSEKSLFDIYSTTYVNENPLLDSFVEHPIAHKLPSLKVTPRSCKSGLMERSSVPIKNRFSSGPMDKTRFASSQENQRKSSAIELKRNSNCSHSFSILYEKKEQPGMGSNDSFLSVTNRRKREGPTSQSKEIILGLWEQEQLLIKEFKPELSGELPTLRMISLEEYVEDVKYLFTGINSGTFQYNSEKGCFDMVYGTCLEDVTPESLFHFSREFMEVGDCYVKLSSCVAKIGKNNFDACTTISQAFWKSIFDYLELHYSLVLEIPLSTNLMALKSCTKDLYDIIKTVAHVCKVNASKDALPQGGELLTYLLQVAEKISKQCVTNIIFGILQNCCNVYFLYVLQSWMFRGRLDGQSNEFFVDYRRQKIKTKSRAYYNSFFLIDEKVPSFLRGYEESFYTCGKSIHFLKLFNPEDKFCQLLEKGDYPTMPPCFTEEHLEKLENAFKNYEDRVLKTCGERITIKTIRDGEKEREKAAQDYIRVCKIIQEKMKEEARLEDLEKAKAEKEKQNQRLNEQRGLIEKEKERKKLEEKAVVQRLDVEMKRMDDKREEMLRKERSLLENYFEEVMQKLDIRIATAGARKERLKEMIIEEARLRTHGMANNESNGYSKEMIDAEGNIVSETDVNANDIDENSNSKSEKLIRVTEKDSELEAQVELDDLENNSAGSISYDENSNPSVGFDSTSPSTAALEKEPEEKEMRRSTSQRNVAAEEARRNKCKVLRSEFGLPVRLESEPPPPPEKPKNPIEMEPESRSERKEPEVSILLKNATTDPSASSLPCNEDADDQKSVRASVDNLKNFKTVRLKRKPECTELGQMQKKQEDTELGKSDSSESYLTPSNEFSNENVSNATEELENVRTPGSSSLGLSEKYQDALMRDAEIFHQKFSQLEVFCSLKDEELDSLPCTDFIKFQRYLRKSALIALKVQEKLANDALLKHLLKGENLLSHLNSLRGYFFFNDGEFGRSFTHHTFRSLSRCTEPKQFFERSNLSTIVNEALNYTIHNFEANSQNLSFRIVKMPPFLNHGSHDVLSPFELSYKVDWPLNVILTEKALSKYKMVFRFLLKLKRINWTLNENFLYLNSHFKRLNGKILVGSSHYHKIQIYRHAMTQVMITLDDYIFSNGIQFPWLFFLKDLETTENIDHLYQKHVRYIKDVLTRCFLSKNSEDLLDCIHNLIELALKFHYTAKSSPMELSNGKYEHPKFSVLRNTFNEFCSILKTFLKTLKEKISLNQVIRSHYVLVEKFDLKLT